MRIAICIIIGIHGFIHVFGFLKAFGIAEFNSLTQPISKPFGIIWLVAFLLFTATLISLLRHYEYWWVLGFLAVLISQCIIIVYWKDAKYGTIVNVLVLVLASIGYATYNFTRKVKDETTYMLANSKSPQNQIVSKEMLTELPGVVKKWLSTSGMVGKESIQSVYLEQEAEMLLKPDQKEWNRATAKQYFTIEPPAFNWSVGLTINPGIPVVGRDKFNNGSGEMSIKLLSTIPVVNAKNNAKIDEATLQRYLAEIVWFPSGALSPYITWEAIDENTAKATMNVNETEGSGIFYFDETGTFKKFVTMRYMDVNDAEPTEWTVIATKSESRNGIKIPVELHANWKLENGNWTWLKLTVTHIEYNVK